jgi:uncharacterized protein (TIGR03000 family)
MLTRVGVPAVVAAVLLMAGPAWAQHPGVGGHGGSFHSGSPHVGSFHPGSFHNGSFHPNSFHRGGYYPGYYYGYYPGYYYGYYPSYDYYPSSSYSPPYDLGYGSAPDQGYLESNEWVAPSFSSGYQPLEPLSPVSRDNTPAQADPTAHVTVRVPANAQVWFGGSVTTSTGSVREFQSPPLSPGRYTYEIRARWTEDGRDITQNQTVAVSPGAHVTVDFPVRTGTN